MKWILAVLLICLLVLSACELVDETKKKAEEEAKKLVCKEKFDTCSDFCKRKGDFKICHSFCDSSYKSCLG